VNLIRSIVDERWRARTRCRKVSCARSHSWKPREKLAGAAAWWIAGQSNAALDLRDRYSKRAGRREGRVEGKGEKGTLDNPRGDFRSLLDPFFIPKSSLTPKEVTRTPPTLTKLLPYWFNKPTFLPWELHSKQLPRDCFFRFDSVRDENTHGDFYLHSLSGAAYLGGAFQQTRAVIGPQVRPLFASSTERRCVN